MRVRASARVAGSAKEAARAVSAQFVAWSRGCNAGTLRLLVRACKSFIIITVFILFESAPPCFRHDDRAGRFGPAGAARVRPPLGPPT
jgi:hypothetical protein